MFRSSVGFPKKREAVPLRLFNGPAVACAMRSRAILLVAIKVPPPLHPIITITEHGRRIPKRETAAIGETFGPVYRYITFLKSVQIRYCYQILSRRGAAKRCLMCTNPAPSCAVFLTGGEGGGGQSISAGVGV